MKKFDESLTNHIQILDKEFSKKFENQISEIQQKSGLFEKNKIKNQNNNIFKTEDEILRKEPIDLKSIKIPSLKKINLYNGKLTMQSFNGLLNAIGVVNNMKNLIKSILRILKELYKSSI